MSRRLCWRLCGTSALFVALMLFFSGTAFALTNDALADKWVYLAGDNAASITPSFTPSLHDLFVDQSKLLYHYDWGRAAGHGQQKFTQEFQFPYYVYTMDPTRRWGWSSFPTETVLASNGATWYAELSTVNWLATGASNGFAIQAGGEVPGAYFGTDFGSVPCAYNSYAGDRDVTSIRDQWYWLRAWHKNEAGVTTYLRCITMKDDFGAGAVRINSSVVATGVGMGSRPMGVGTGQMYWHEHYEFKEFPSAAGHSPKITVLTASDMYGGYTIDATIVKEIMDSSGSALGKFVPVLVSNPTTAAGLPGALPPPVAIDASSVVASGSAGDVLGEIQQKFITPLSGLFWWIDFAKAALARHTEGL